MGFGRTNYTAGRDYEYRVRDALQDDGYACFRAAGSKGKADLVALKPGEILLVQVKRSNPQLSPIERAELLELARITGGRPIVAYKPLRKPVVYRELTGPGPKDWKPFYTDQVEASHMTEQQMKTQQQVRLAERNQAENQCPSCGAFTADGRPPALHHPNCTIAEVDRRSFRTTGTQSDGVCHDEAPPP